MIHTLATISGNQLIDTLIWLVGVGLIFYLLWWLVGYCAPPDPIAKVCRVILACALVVVLIKFIMQLAGHPVF